MKRATGIILIILSCIIASISVGRSLPLIPIFDSSFAIIIAVALILPALFLYRAGIRRAGNRLYRSIVTLIFSEEKRVNEELSRKIEAAEKKMDTTEQALLQFSSAIADYAKHLASHTSAIQGLSQASYELKKGAAEQNRVLSAIMENVVKTGCGQEPSPVIKGTTVKTQKPIPRPEKPTGTKIPPFHGALYKTERVKPPYKIETSIPPIEKPELVTEKPASPSVHPTPKPERLKIVTNKPKLDVEKLAQVPVQPEHGIERLVPLADRLVINARKSMQKAEEKPAKSENTSIHKPVDTRIPPGCARQHQEQLWY